MKLQTRTKPAIKPKSEAPVVIQNADCSELAETFVTIFDELSSELVGRHDEIEALKFAILTRSHVMLEGPQGTAKSALASAVFSRFEEVSMFHHQFTGASDRDQIFGPMMAELYRTKAIYSHNTKGHLPTAHFFFADEVYRASPAVLSTLFGILNEREFNNGTGIEKCPLITAVGTTNFETDDDELEAFHDRWTIKAFVRPLSSATHIHEMFRCVTGKAARDKAKRTTMPLEDLLYLQQAVDQVTIPPEILQVFAEMCVEVTKLVASHKLPTPSNRRMVAALRFLRASAVLDGRNTVNFPDVDRGRFVLFPIGKEQMENDWAGLFGRFSKEHDLLTMDRNVLDKFSLALRKSQDRYDENMSKAEATKEYSNLAALLTSAKKLSADALPKSQAGLAEWHNTVARLEELHESYRSLAIPTAKKPLSGYEDDTEAPENDTF